MLEIADARWKTIIRWTVSGVLLLLALFIAIGVLTHAIPNKPVGWFVIVILGMACWQIMSWPARERKDEALARKLVQERFDTTLPK